ncbi:MAG: hypothetical protein JOZ82_10720, partial [Marmoricola sp.]|nr:hypothetical protein [Marmoricola sp.]
MTRRGLLGVLVCALTGTLLTGCGGAHAGSQARSAAHGSPTASPSSATPVVPTARARVASWRLRQPSSRQALVDLGGGQVLLAGGMLPGDVSTGIVRRVDLRTGRSSGAPALAVPVHDAAGGLFGGAPAVFGGGNATEQSLVQALRGSSWRRVAAFPTTRSDLSVVTTPYGTIALGGYDGTSVPRTVYGQQGQGGLRLSGQLVRGVRY